MDVGHNHIHLHLGMIGLLPAASRQVMAMPSALRGLVPVPTDNNVTIKTDSPDVEQDTMPVIIDKIKRTVWQTKKLAAKLKGKTLEETLRSDCEFILRYIKYKKDEPGQEQIRSPRRLIHEGKGDCDCFVVTLGSLLANQKIDFRLRIAKYTAGDDWSHIYVIVPKKSAKPVSSRSDYYVLDPVTNRYDYEVPYQAKKDYTMALQYLDGLPSPSQLGDCSQNSQFQKVARRYVYAQEVMEKGLVPTRKFLKENKIPFTEGVDANNSGFFFVMTVAGTAKVPTIISKTDAQGLLASIGSPVSITSSPVTTTQAVSPAVTPTTLLPISPPPVDHKPPFNWLKWGLIALGAYGTVKLFERKPSPAVAGLGKLKLVHI